MGDNDKIMFFTPQRHFERERDSFRRRGKMGYSAIHVGQKLVRSILIRGAVAQLGECQTGSLEVGGSIPPSSTMIRRLS